jgi:WD40 repeat protein
MMSYLTDYTSSVMALAVSNDRQYCVSVAADHQIVLYDIKEGAETKSVRSNSAGHASIAIREDGQVIAVGGWDGCIRLYDSQLTQLGSLRYHKDTVQALSFVQTRHLKDLNRDNYDSDDASDSDKSEDGESKKNENLLVSGGKEGRICLWKT